MKPVSVFLEVPWSEFFQNLISAYDTFYHVDGDNGILCDYCYLIFMHFNEKSEYA